MSLTWLIRAIVGRNDWRFFGPMGVLMMCYLYYCVVGPWVNHLFTPMDFCGLSFYDGVNSAAITALLSFGASFAGYVIFAQRGEVAIGDNSAFRMKFALPIYMLFFGCYLASQSANLDKIYNIRGGASEVSLNDGLDLKGFEVYFYMMMSSCVACVVVMWSQAVGRIAMMFVAALSMVNLLLVFLATGFRLRIAFMGLCIISMMMLRFRSLSSWRHGGKWLIMQRVFAIGALCLGAMVLMSSARKYGQGLDLEALASTDKVGMVVNAFNDSAIYYTNGLVVDYVVASHDYAYFDTVRAAALRMIPSAIIGEKPTPRTVEIVNMAMGGTTAAFSAGFAVPFYGEHFICFGWLGLVLGSFMLGVSCAWVSNQLIRRASAMNAFIFSMFSGYVFIFFHRGYFPQQLDYFMFMVILPYVCFRLVSPGASKVASSAF